MSRIQVVDAMRGLAASVVVFHHAMVIFPTPFQHLREKSELLFQLAQFVSACNGEAVALFFVISGFSIRLSTNRLDLSLKQDVNQYLYKRFKRLLPLYWLALVLTVGLALPVGSLGESFSLMNLVGNLLFLQSPAGTRGNWFVPFGGNSPLWSLSFEMFFYLMFPLVVIIQRKVFGKNPCWSTLPAILLVCAISFGSLALYNLAPNPITLFASQLLIWYLGVEIGEVHLQHKQALDGFVFYVLLWLLVGGIVTLTGSATLNGVLVGLSIFMLWRVLQIFPPGNSRMLQAGVSFFCTLFGGLGLISYGLYLLHYPIMKYFATIGADSPALALGGAVPTCIGLAYLAEALAKRFPVGYLKRRYWA